TAARHSVLSSGQWVKMEVVQDGMYKIDATYLRAVGIEPASLSSIYDIKIFGSDGKRLDTNLSAARPDDLPQVAVYYSDANGNGKFDTDDYVLFYGQGISGWNYTSASKEYAHYTNPYTNSNYYFLGISSALPAKQAAVVSIAPASGGTVTTAAGKVFFDEERINFNQSGLNWVSAPFNPGDSRVISNKLNGWVNGSAVRYKYLLYSRSNVGANFRLDESGQFVANSSIGSMSNEELDDPRMDYARENQWSGQQATTYPALSDQRSNLKLTYTANSNVATGFIDWIEIFYTEELTASNDQLTFVSPDTNGTVQFHLSSFSTNAIEVFDVTDVAGIRKMAGQNDQIFGSYLFSDTLSSGRPKKYWTGTAAQFRTPLSSVKVPNSDLHGFPGAEFIIITHSEFKSEAERLKAHKESLPVPLSTMVADVDTIYNEFGIGMPDPVALRDFLRWAYTNWTVKPKYVLFFGDASYDYKSILNTDRSWVPTIETIESNNKIDSYSYDDFFAYLDPQSPVTVSLAHGRLCPRSADDARVIVDRIIQYESKPVFDPWKNKITIVADDLWTPEYQNETEHTIQAEELSNPPYTPNSFEVQKIFLGEYPTVYTSSGRRKPDARQAILDDVNAGTLLLNFTGHGNPKVWAHESVLTLDDVKTQFNNSDKLTFIVAATCDWGRFDEAGEQSSAEEVVVNRKGGAIGVLSATRAVYSIENSQTNKLFYQNLFWNTPSLPLGDVTMLTKNGLTNNIINEQKYFLLGDPTLRLAIPEGTLSVDSVNDNSIAIVDTLQALQKVTIKSSVRDQSNTLLSGYNGTALVTIFDSEKSTAFKEIPNRSYVQNGAVLYRGENSVKNGTLEATFIVPKDISYENKNGRISVYFSNGSDDGRGFTKNIVIGGTSAVSAADTVGPSMSVYFDNTTFRSGDVVNENPLLIVDLKDSSGINSSGSGIGHRIEGWIDGSSKSIDLTGSYNGKKDTYQEGTVEYQLSNVSVGNHYIKIRGWDVYNNSSTAEAYFTIASSEGLSIQKLYNFPNPVTTTTSFTFQQNQLIPIDVDIDIYTVAGRLIHRIKRYAVSDRFVKIDWDRRDSDGDEVGNGIYFYRVIARTIDGKYSSEATGKLAVVR
ncbi:MAG: type IX secretion system sortase PorU, partial [Bacteroidota bacterium]